MKPTFFKLILALGYTITLVAQGNKPLFPTTTESNQLALSFQKRLCEGAWIEDIPNPPFGDDHYVYQFFEDGRFCCSYVSDYASKSYGDWSLRITSNNQYCLILANQQRYPGGATEPGIPTTGRIPSESVIRYDESKDLLGITASGFVRELFFQHTLDRHKFWIR